MIGLTLKVRFAPSITKAFAKRIRETFDRDVVLHHALGLVGKIDPDRQIRLLGLRAEMTMPEDARKDHSPTRSGW